MQDTSTFKSRDEGASASATIGPASGGSISVNRSRVDADYASVGEQSGINAGDGGFQITVKGNTDLQGAKIASTDKAVDDGKNSLTTATLTASDIENRSQYSAESQSASVGSGGGGIGIGSASGSESSTTKSGVSGGAVTITDAAAQEAKTGKTPDQTVASLDDTVRTGKDSSNSLNKNWDGDELRQDVEAQAKITQAFGQQAAKLVGDIAGTKRDELKKAAEDAKQQGDTDLAAELAAEAAKWDEGGIYRVAAHTAIGALGGGVGGAMGAAASASLMPEISKQIDKMDLPSEVKSAVALAAAAGIGALAGGTSGAASAFNVDLNNRQLHSIEKALLKKNATRFAKQLFGTEDPTEEQIKGALVLLVNTAQNLVDNNLGYDVPHSKYAESFIRLLQSEYSYISQNLSIDNGQHLFYSTPDQMNSPYINSGSLDKEISDLIIKTPINKSEIDLPNNTRRDLLTNLPLDEQGRYSQQILVDGISYTPKYFPCATPECLGKNLDMSDPQTISYVKAVDKKILSDIGDGASTATLINPAGSLGKIAGFVGPLSSIASGIVDGSPGAAVAKEALSAAAASYMKNIYGLSETVSNRITTLVDMAGGWKAFIDRIMDKK